MKFLSVKTICFLILSLVLSSACTETARQHGMVSSQPDHLNFHFYHFNLSTVPEASSVFIDGEFVGKTPLDLHISPFTDSRIVLEKDGYAPTLFQIDSGGESEELRIWNYLSGASGDIHAKQHFFNSVRQIEVPLLSHKQGSKSLYNGRILLTNLSHSRKQPQ